MLERIYYHRLLVGGKTPPLWLWLGWCDYTAGCSYYYPIPIAICIRLGRWVVHRYGRLQNERPAFEDNIFEAGRMIGYHEGRNTADSLNRLIAEGLFPCSRRGVDGVVTTQQVTNLKKGLTQGEFRKQIMQE